MLDNMVATGFLSETVGDGGIVSNHQEDQESAELEKHPNGKLFEKTSNTVPGLFIHCWLLLNNVVVRSLRMKKAETKSRQGNNLL